MKKGTLIFQLTLIFTLNSCFFYNSQFTPPVLIESKNDVQLNAGNWYNGVIPGGYGSLTYGVSNNIYIQGYTIFEGNNLPKYYEASAAWYMPVNNVLRMGIHAGYFHKKVKTHSIFNFTESQDIFTGSVQCPFINLQSIFTWENTIMAVGSKIGYYQSNIMKKNNENIEFGETSPSYSEKIKNNALLIEPTIYLMPRTHGVNMTISFSYSRPFFIPINTPAGYKKYDEAFNPAGNFAIGLLYHFNLNQLIERLKK